MEILWIYFKKFFWFLLKKNSSTSERCITSTNVFGNKHTTTEIIARIMDDCRVKVIVKVNTIFFSEWMTAALSATELDILIQRMDGYY